MTFFFRTALVLALAAPLVLSACAGEPTPPEEMEGASVVTPPAPDPAPADGAARMDGGVQVVEIEAGRMGYQPSSVQLQAGVPARLVFTRTVESDCSSQITVPAYGVPVTDLPLNEPVAIEFTPTEAGTAEFVCGMDMQRGAIVVTS